MHWQSRRETFRSWLDGDRCLHPASVYDPVSARIAEDLDFEVGMFAGSVASLTVLGDPDHILLTLSEFAQQAYRINRACTLPLMVDADHGYGNALNVMRTVEELESAGVCGLSIEDTELPLGHGKGGKAGLVSVEEGLGKMKAAVSARQDPQLVIAARTSAPGISGTDDTLERISAYQETGVDAMFLVGVKTRAQLEAISSLCRLPLIIGGAGSDLMDLDYLSSLGVRICLQGHQPMMAAIEATYRTLSALRSGTLPADLNGLPDAGRISRYSREHEYDRWIEEFL